MTPIEKKPLAVALAAMLWCSTPVLAEDTRLLSPDGTIELSISTDGGVSYSVTVDDTVVIEQSALTMEIGSDLTAGEGGALAEVERFSVDDEITPVVSVKANAIRQTFNAARLSFEEGYDIEFRAFNNGVAYRFATHLPGEVTVRSESAQFKVVNATTVYYPEEEGFMSHNERSYVIEEPRELEPDRLASLPVLFATDGPNVLFSETDLQSYPGMWVRNGAEGELQATFPPYPLKAELLEGSDRNKYVIEAADYIAKTKGTRHFPWRFFAVEREDGGLLTNQLSYLLAEESRLDDTDWIRPGNVAWDWFNYNNVIGVDFRAGVNTATYKHYIDFASQFGIDYVILDEGWYELGDILNVVPDMDIEELVSYGREKNVQIILWVIWTTLDDQMQEAMAQFEDWGVAGLKIDFMQRDDQPVVDFYWRAAEESAKRKLLVNFHGAYKPAGLRRTYPNVLTREGVIGLEHNKWSEVVTPSHNLTIPFIRMVAGPMDYTPGAMINAQPENFRAVFNRPMSMGTRAHQMAMYVIYESPMQMLADTPTHYMREPLVTAFIASVPTVWDETRVIEAEIGETILMARRSGDDWYVGAMTDEDARSVVLDTSFLPEGKYQVNGFADGINADRYASDVRQMVRTLSSGESIRLDLAPGGGWVGRITRIEN